MKIGPRYKIARRLGADVFDKTQTQKYALRESQKSPSKKKMRSKTDYGVQFNEKQRVRFTYGVSEKQFSNYVIAAMEKAGSQSPAELLFSLLESRLDNVIYRLGFTGSRQMARQMSNHGHFTINGKRVNIPSYKVSLGDKIGIREASNKKVLFTTLAEKMKTITGVPSWIKFDLAKKIAEIQGAPKLVSADVKLNFPAVIEFYSR